MSAAATNKSHIKADGMESNNNKPKLEFKETRPGPTKPPQISGIGLSSMTVAWIPPEDNGGSPVTDYILEYREPAVGRWFLVKDGIKETSTTVTILKPSTVYEFRVFIKNKIGRSRASEPSEKCSTASPTVPGPPHRVSPSNVDTTCITLKWKAPEDDGGSPVSEYIVEHKGVTSSKWLRSHQNLVSDTSFTVMGLNWMDDYQFRVIAKNSVGRGQPSDATQEYRCSVGKWKLANEIGHRGSVKTRQADGICQCDNNGVAIADSQSGCVKIYKDGKFKMALDTCNELKPWQHSRPIQVKVNFTGTLFVSDSTQYVKVYDKRGIYERKFVAVSHEDIPSDSHNYTRLCGLAFDNNGHILVGGRFFGTLDAIQSRSFVSKHQQDGTYLETFEIKIEPSYIAVTTRDTIVISSENPECIVQIYAQSGSLLRTITPTAGVVDWVPKGIACCRDTIFIANNSFRGQAGVYCYSVAGEYIDSVTEQMSSAFDIVVIDDGNKILLSLRDRVVSFERIV